MAIKLNKDIRTYTESMFLECRYGIFFSALGCLVSVAIYFLLRGQLGTEAVSWACMLGVFPFGVMGFAKYNGMAAEQVLWAVVKSAVLTPMKLPFRGTNLYYDVLPDEERIETIKAYGTLLNSFDSNATTMFYSGVVDQIGEKLGAEG